MKKRFLALAFGAFACANAMAAPVALPAGPIFVQYNNAEQFSPINSIVTTNADAISATNPTGTVTEGNWGIIQVSSLQFGTAFLPAGSDIGGGPSFFSAGLTGPQITGIFYGAQTTSGGYSTGGVLDLYWHDSGSMNVSVELTSAANLAKRTNQTTYLGFADASDASMTFLGQFVFRPGCEATHVQTICSPVTPGSANGTAQSYQDVNVAAGGAWAAGLDTNYFTLDADGNSMGSLGAADIRTESNFSSNGGSAWSDLTNGIVGLRSNDPIRGVQIPEPASLALVGIGLLAIVGFRRRRSV